jgi:hypothetical protein
MGQTCLLHHFQAGIRALSFELIPLARMGRLLQIWVDSCKHRLQLSREGLSQNNAAGHKQQSTLAQTVGMFETCNLVLLLMMEAGTVCGVPAN